MDTYITTIAGKTAVVTVQTVMDGGMVEFHDAVTGESRGSAGIHWWKEQRHWVKYDGPLPQLPFADLWT